MEMEQIEEGSAATHPAPPKPRRRLSFLLLLNVGLMILGGSAGPLLLRLYFVHGGARLWLSSLVQLCGSPLLLLPLYLSYLSRRSDSPVGAAEMVLITLALTAGCVGLGILMGVGCYFYAIGTSYLPLSTSGIIVSTQLAFTAVFALVIVRLRFTPYSLNSVVLLTMGPVVLSLQVSSDRPEGVSKGRYYLGFFMSIGAAAMTGLVMPLVELLYKKSKKAVTYALVMEMQFVMGLTGSIFCLAGMAINKDFQAISSEARAYSLGQVKYYVILVLDIIFWQLLNIGLAGVIFTSSSLVAGIIVAVLLPVTTILSVIFFHDKFDGSKGIALVLSLWGFVSYLYGERRQDKKKKKAGAVSPSLSAS